MPNYDLYNFCLVRFAKKPFSKIQIAPTTVQEQRRVFHDLFFAAGIMNDFFPSNELTFTGEEEDVEGSTLYSQSAPSG